MLAKIILGGTNMNYSEIFIKNDTEYVTDESGCEYRVFNSEKYNGEKYIHVQNRLNTDDDSFFSKFFSGRIKDAIETIKNGDADAICVSRFFGNEIIYVVHFIHREFGEKIRSQTLEGWKDAEFGWVINFGNRYSMSGSYPLNDKNETCSPFDREQPKIFSTREEAKTHITELLDTAKKYAAKYSNMAVDKSDEEIDKLQLDMFHELENSIGLRNVIATMTFDMVDNKLNIHDNFELRDYRYDFKQYLKPRQEIADEGR